MIILKKAYRIFAFLLTAALIIAVIAAIIYFLVKNNEERKTLRGAVVTNGYDCSRIGADILKKGGSVVDAAIAALFCEGVSMPQSMGLGGGFLMTIYIKETNKVVSLNAREMAPMGATEDMYHGNSTLSSKGGLAVAVPGELRGYWEAHKKFGVLPWRDLVLPTVQLCRNGVVVTKYLAKFFATQIDILKQDEGLRETFINPETSQTYEEGLYIKRLKLANTLELIAEHGVDVFYNGNLTKPFVDDIQEKNGIITEEDMHNYSVEWQEPIRIDLPFNQVMYSSPLPGSGVILSFIMNILNGFLDYSKPESVTNWQRIIESFKYGYGRRTELGDMNFVDLRTLVEELTSPIYAAKIREQISDDTTFQDPEHYGANTTQSEDHGTAHISVLAPNGDAVSVTSTINLYFGAKFMSKSTGIILNDEMDDFSAPGIINAFGLPPSPANYIKPGKRPLSSMCPAIIVNEDGDVRLIVGAAGGTKITTAVVQTIIKNLWFNISIPDAVNSKRLHHQLFPMEVSFENTFTNFMDFVNAIHQIGHNYSIAGPSSGFSSVTSISRENGILKGATDKRRSGTIAYVDL